MTDDDIFELAYESTELFIRYGTLDFSFYQDLKDKLSVIQQEKPKMTDEDKEKFNQNIKDLNECLKYLLKRDHDS